MLYSTALVHFPFVAERRQLKYSVNLSSRSAAKRSSYLLHSLTRQNEDSEAILASNVFDAEEKSIQLLVQCL